MQAIVRRIIAVVTVAGSVVAFTACSSDDGSDQAASTCTALQGLASSVRDLTSVDVARVGTDGLTAALDDVEQAAKDVRQEASKQFEADVDALQDAIKTFSEDVAAGRGEEPVADYVSRLGDDISAIGTAYDQLSADARDELDGCDLSGSSG